MPVYMGFWNVFLSTLVVVQSSKMHIKSKYHLSKGSREINGSGKNTWDLGKNLKYSRKIICGLGKYY